MFHATSFSVAIREYWGGARMDRHMNVKICGMTNYEDAASALELGADRIGFVLSGSPRAMEAGEIGWIVSRLRERGMLEGRKAVGVFTDEGAGEIEAAMRAASLDEAQIEGGLSPEDCAALSFPWYKTLRISSVEEAERRLGAGWRCGRILVDSGELSAAAGRGRTIGVWATLAARAIARELGKEFILAGGIAPRNVASVVFSVMPDGIDLCSGVEDEPGRKSREKMALLFAELGRALEEAEALKEIRSAIA